MWNSKHDRIWLMPYDKYLRDFGKWDSFPNCDIFLLLALGWLYHLEFWISSERILNHAVNNHSKKELG